MDILVVCLIFINGIIMGYYSALYWILRTEDINTTNWFYAWLIYDLAFIGFVLLAYLLILYIGVHHWKQNTGWVIDKLLPSRNVAMFAFVILLMLGLSIMFSKHPPFLTTRYLLEDENSSINKYDLVLYFRMISLILVLLLLFLIYVFRT